MEEKKEVKRWAATRNRRIRTHFVWDDRLEEQFNLGRKREFAKVRKILKITDKDIAPIFGYKDDTTFRASRSKAKYLYERFFVDVYLLIAPRIEEIIRENIKNYE